MIASGSHIPVFVLLAQLRPIRRLLELGSGCFSSPMFQDDVVFPDLTHLDVLENGEAWYYEAVRREFFTDPWPGCRLHYEEGVPMAKLAAPFLHYHDYDVVFIDDSVTVDARVDTIAFVTSQTRAPIVVAHDFEEPSYRDAVQGDWRRSVFTHATPHTAVLWRERFVNLDELDRYHETITRAFPEHKESWRSWHPFLRDLVPPR